LPRGLEELFPARGHAARVGRRGQVAAPPVTHAHAQAVEARPNDVSRVAAPRSRWRGTPDGRSVWPKLVACGGTQSAANCPAGSVLRVARGTSTRARMNLNSPNRRMRTRMSGGVGGK